VPAVPAAAPALPVGVQRVTERASAGPALMHVHPHWADTLPWLSQGITPGGADMSLFGRAAVGAVVPRWLELPGALGCRAIVHARQVHRGHVLVHDDIPAGLHVAGDADGHITARPGILLAVSVADCVPVSIVAAGSRAVALLHAGWRSAAAGILERGVETIFARTGADSAALHVHLGPAICGECFEVGPEVPVQLGLATGAYTADADGRCRLDLRAELAGRAMACGVPAARISVSTFCTRCGDSPFFSHRGGCHERQIAVLGIRDDR
jgi:polyphenol oxidase